MNRAWPLVGLLWAAPAAAQTHTETCLPADQIDAGQGVRLAIAPDGTRHLLRIKRLGGHLLHTQITPAGTETAQVAQRISRLAIDEVTRFDLRWHDGGLDGCWYNASQRRVELGRWTPEAGWAIETVSDEAGVADGCALGRTGDRLWVIYRTADALRARWRQGEGPWTPTLVDDVGGFEPDALVLADGRLVVAHRQLPGSLRVSVWDDGWQSSLVPTFGPDWGVSPQVVGDLRHGFGVVHGLLGQDSDAGVVYSVRRGEGWASELRVEDEVGGASDAVRGPRGRLWVATRQLRRSAVFGRADGLSLYADWAQLPLAHYGSAEQRHRFEYVSVALDPFGEPVVAALDERAPFQGLPAGGFTCWYAPLDADADRVPDVAEARLGTDPDEADSDGDGRTDGEEMLDDGTNPLGDGPWIPPDAGPPEPDAEVPDAEVPDAEVPDAEVPDAEVPDAEVPDAEVPDAEVPDAEVPDAEGPDASQPDAAAPDAAEADAAVADAAVADAEADAGLVDAEVPADQGPAPDAATGPDGGRADAASPEPDAVAEPDLGGHPIDEAEADGCRSTPGGAPGWLALLLLGLRRRR